MVSKIQNPKFGLFLWCTTLLLLFVVLPYSLMSLGYSGTVMLTFVIGITGLLSDGFLTKIGLNIGCSESNIMFLLVKRRINADYMIILSRITGGVFLTYMLVVFNDAFLLLAFATLIIVCVIANSITLFSKVSSKTHLPALKHTQYQHRTATQKLSELAR